MIVHIGTTAAFKTSTVKTESLSMIVQPELDKTMGRVISF